MARPRAISSHSVTPLREGWQLCLLPANASKGDGPAALSRVPCEWLAASVPGTAASALRALGRWSLLEDKPDNGRDFDAAEVWYRCRFPAAPGAGERVLRFEGLATLCDVWLNGAHLLRSETMFRPAEAEVTALLRTGGEENELLLRFSSLDAFLSARRPRPRWKTRLVKQQQLRWVRTTLLGRIPGWSPRPAAVGPFGEVTLEERRAVSVEECRLRCALDGDDGVVTLSLLAAPLQDERAREEAAAGAAWAWKPLPAAVLVVGEHRAPLAVARAADGKVGVQGTLRIPRAPRWWPHTHGPQPLFEARVELVGFGSEPVALDLGRVGFRALEARREEGGFQLVLNGQPVFARGACWTPLDVAALRPAPEVYRAALTQVRDAGMNLLRVGGTMAWEPACFWDLCDELGILVWQDYQFANLDYPVGDAAFAAEVRAEAAAQVGALQGRPSLAVLCGGSEVEQQAAMLGLPRESWSGPLFEQLLPEASAQHAPGVPYVQNSPTGGALPFRVSEGIAHYYGVGAYLRPPEDARRANLRFTSECLAFAHVPSQALLDRLLGDGQVAPHHPRWKERVPRDSGAGWDFDDVRDHYFKLLLGLDPAAVRYADPMRYLDLSRLVSGELTAQTLSEWRRGRSTCKGAITWLLRDLWPGAGWGLFDSEGGEKPALWPVRRALQPRAISIADEGLDGLRLHVFNDGSAPLAGRVRLALYRDDGAAVASGEREVLVAPHGEAELDGAGFYEGFLDLTWAYKFGPPSHSVAVATLLEGGQIVSQAFHWPVQRDLRPADLGLSAKVEPGPAPGQFVLVAEAQRPAYGVHLEVEGFAAADDWFCLEPRVPRRLALGQTKAGARPGGYLVAVNGREPARIAGGTA